MTNQSFEQRIDQQTNLESSEKGDAQFEIDKLEEKLKQLLNDRKIEDLEVDGRAEVLELMRQVEELQRRMLLEQKEKEQYWTREMFVDWARDEVGSNDPDEWVEENLDLSDMTQPRFKLREMRLFGLDGIKRIPPYIKGEYIDFGYTKVRKISKNVQCDFLNLAKTNIKSLPGIKMMSKRINISGTEVHAIENGLVCKDLVMRNNQIDYIGEDIEIDRLSISKGFFSDEIREQLIRLKEEGKINHIYIVDEENDVNVFEL
ncbi:hypothetical protein HN958_00355 [Candidatus Falkowbacteria bacterium]|jgi:hypothetical protein|nr:hypothetical protein [Candidatus Falkowbacteria bacterium]MBT7006940.1 hypothetical protein [Candidatus Falkowbacteria bacterium]